MVLLLGLAAFGATMLGGLFALRYRDKLHLILGFSAGAVIGVAFLDLLPESIQLASANYKIAFVTTLIAAGFLVFMVLDRFLQIHACGQDKDCENQNHRGFHGAIALVTHSFIDGLAIGLAFKVSPAVGAVVTAAVLAHDFSDGINTVNYILKNKGGLRPALFWLIMDAAAPIAGIGASFFINISDAVLGLILAVFCGFFLYIGASDLVPESHHRHPTFVTTLMTLLGIAFLYTIIYFAQI